MRGKAAQINLRGCERPFYVRLDSTDWLVLEEIFRQGEYSFVAANIPRADCILDLGANSGFSLRYWNQLYPAARIIAVEPDKSNCEACWQNACLAAMGQRVVLIQAAIGPRRALGSLLRSGGEWAYRAQAGAPAGADPVEFFSIEDILQAHSTQQSVDLLKCDIEGGERDLFHDCAAWIDRVRFIAVELHPPYTVEELKNDLKSNGAFFTVLTEIRRKASPVVLLQIHPKLHPARPATAAPSLP
jgi:FkbM family methyltransferase